MGWYCNIPRWKRRWCRETLFLFWLVSTSIKSKRLGWQGLWRMEKLKIDIGKEAISGKNPVICNGGYTCQTDEIAKVFKCMSCHHTKQESPKSVSSEKTYCFTTLVNNCQNGRGNQNLKDTKRIKTTTKYIICKFSFTIEVDHLGFLCSSQKSYFYIHLLKVGSPCVAYRNVFNDM